MPGRLGILGGTLDPTHCGHVSAAVAARDALGLSEVRLVPAHVPPHRPIEPTASPFHRFAMAALAVHGLERLIASDEELLQDGPSFTADTLERLHRSGFERSQIFFITGVDSFAEIATWRRYPEVLDLAHFVVIPRAGHSMTDLPRRLPDLAPRMRSAPGTVAEADKTLIFLVTASTPDVSSTIVRERLRQGKPVTGLVPPLVEAHIRQHRLYSPAITADQLHDEI